MAAEPESPRIILERIFQQLRNADETGRLAAIRQLHDLNFSSEAVRSELEQLALHDESAQVRVEALAALDLPTSRHIRTLAAKLTRDDRKNLIREIEDWQKSRLLDSAQADVLRRRYDFDVTRPQAQPKPAPAPQAELIGAAPPESPAPVATEGTLSHRTEPVEAEVEGQPPRSFLQALLSETSIKIALYLGAFFVIASAIILGTVVEAARLPILLVSLAIFGGLALAIRKRLPQPSFALFIVFSFLLPITANVVEETMNLTGSANAVYWVFVSALMALVWAVSTWLYQSRLFSVTAFLALAIALSRVGDIFEAEAAFRGTMLGVAALAGLSGVSALKHWKDAKFSLPLLLAAQLLQAGVLGFSLMLLTTEQFDSSISWSWHLASVFTWGLAFCFYAFSYTLDPFPLLPWLAAGTLIPIPWFITAALDLEAIPATILFFVWGVIVSMANEWAHRLEAYRKYSLPILLASIPTFGAAVIFGFVDGGDTGFLMALGTFLAYSALHLLRARGWLWGLALFNFIIAYFTFFHLGFLEKADIFIGYQLLGLSLLLLLPDLLLNNDFRVNLSWRLPPRLYGAFFTLVSFISLAPSSDEPFPTAVIFGIYTVFFAIYAWRYQRPLIGYISTFALVIVLLHILDYFNSDAWLPALIALAIFYFGSGLAIRDNRNWSLLFRNSALGLAGSVSFAALIALKESGGWYALAAGLLFAAEMYLRNDGWFEPGLPVMFNIGAFLILRDLNIEELSYHLFAYSLVWLLTDLLAHLTFVHPRLLKWPVRGVGALLTILNVAILLFEGMGDPRPGILSFGIYTLLFLVVSLLYRQPKLLYAFTAILPLFMAFLFREFDVTKWIHPVISIAVLYYVVGYYFRRAQRYPGWDTTLLFSGLGLGLIVSAAAPVLGGLDAAIPVAVAATLWAVEAFARRNVWLGFPANALYLLAYFIILFELRVDEPQFYSMGAASLGLLQHYFLTRANAKTGALITGMLSQLILLGTTYIQMLDTEELIYFVVLFFQSIAVLVYGIVIRSRSLTFMPIGFVVLGVVTVIYSALKGISTVVLIGCTGVILLMLGILAVVMRERITRIGERLSSWQA